MPKKTKEFQNAASLQLIADQWRSLVARIDAAKDTMELHEIEPLYITGHADLKGGMER